MQLRRAFEVIAMVSCVAILATAAAFYATARYERQPPSHQFQLICNGQSYTVAAERYSWEAGGCAAFTTRTGYQPAYRLCSCSVVADLAQVQGQKAK